MRTFASRWWRVFRHGRVRPHFVNCLVGSSLKSHASSGFRDGLEATFDGPLLGMVGSQTGSDFGLHIAAHLSCGER
jgi:hypothetical protein